MSLESGAYTLSPHPIGQRILDLRTSLEGAQDDDGPDGFARKFWRDIQGDADKAENVDLQHFTRATYRFEILPTEVPQTKIQTFSDRRFPHHICVAFELVADCSSDEIGPVRVKAFLDEQIDLPEIDKPEIDRDFLAVTRFWAEVVYRGHLLRSIYHLHGW